MEGVKRIAKGKYLLLLLTGAIRSFLIVLYMGKSVVCAWITSDVENRHGFDNDIDFAYPFQRVGKLQLYRHAPEFYWTCANCTSLSTSDVSRSHARFVVLIPTPWIGLLQFSLLKSIILILVIPPVAFRHLPGAVKSEIEWNNSQVENELKLFPVW
jgi:hypothetical protein